MMVFICFNFHRPMACERRFLPCVVQSFNCVIGGLNGYHPGPADHVEGDLILSYLYAAKALTLSLRLVRDQVLFIQHLSPR
jgi:hypothetical protein